MSGPGHWCTLVFFEERERVCGTAVSVPLFHLLQFLFFSGQRTSGNDGCRRQILRRNSVWGQVRE